MKLLKTICLLLFVFSVNSIFGQASISDNDYVKGSISQLKTQFTKVGSSATLSDAQVLKLEKIFAEKEVKFNSITSKYRDKGDLGAAFAELDKEYLPQVESVLNFEQKTALRKATQKPVAPTK